MSDILDTARELLDLLARPDKWADDGLSTHEIAKVCRALIARTEALRALVDALDDGEGLGCVFDAARKALAEEL